MASNKYSIIAFLSFFSLALLLPYQAFGSKRSGFIPKNYDAPGFPPSAGLCSTGVTIHGYKCQEFQVTTDDGYILSVQRIPEGLAGGGGAAHRPPVLLQHGLFVDGMTWLINSPQESLAFILADNGFDVWISNIRGTRYSRKHVTLDPSNPLFWEWSWDDLATHDLPTFINLVFNQTGQKVHYVGHSMGTLIAFAMFSQGKQTDKIKSAALLSPIAYVSHMTTQLTVAASRSFLGEQGRSIGLAEFNIKGAAETAFIRAVCENNGLNCYDLMSAFTGINCCLNSSTIDSFIQNEPQSTSTKNLIHFSQTIRDGILMKYDYGPYLNTMHYGTPGPPVYDLTKIPNDLPLFLSYGARDALADVFDVNILLESLRSHDSDKLKSQLVEEYAHVDFIMGVNANDIVYNQMMGFFRSHS